MREISAAYQKVSFLLRHNWHGGFRSAWRKLSFRALGMHIGRKTHLGRITVPWPHQVKIGSQCLFEDNTALKFDGPWQPGPCILIGDNCFIGRDVEFNIRQKIVIGNNALIASGSRFIDHDHGIAKDSLMRVQPSVDSSIEIGDDCWIGVNAVILKGVKVGNGSVLAAGAVLTKTVPPYEIWAGIPARKIASRE
jgi:acetyltransferase-like isoleucine patch superfamily enzyme